jgi:hypothetical protein
MLPDTSEVRELAVVAYLGGWATGSRRFLTPMPDGRGGIEVDVRIELSAAQYAEFRASDVARRALEQRGTTKP